MLCSIFTRFSVASGPQNWAGISRSSRAWQGVEGIGANIGVITDPSYGGAWWGEGEVKCYLDGDREFPTLCGTGTEDYINRMGAGCLHATISRLADR